MKTAKMHQVFQHWISQASLTAMKNHNHLWKMLHKMHMRSSGHLSNQSWMHWNKKGKKQLYKKITIHPLLFKKTSGIYYTKTQYCQFNNSIYKKRLFKKTSGIYYTKTQYCYFNSIFKKRLFKKTSGIYYTKTQYCQFISIFKKDYYFHKTMFSGIPKHKILHDCVLLNIRNIKHFIYQYNYSFKIYTTFYHQPLYFQDLSEQKL